MNIYSYIVRYDSGFAPNPFYGYCTLANCKPIIRGHAQVNDWVVGTGSASKKIKQGGRLVYAMKVSEALSFNEYFTDPRFENKKPIINGSKKQARGDNIYFKEGGSWSQLNSFHSHDNGSPHTSHIAKDTKVDRVLVSNKFRYFGLNGPRLPPSFCSNNKSLCHKGRAQSKFSNSNSNDALMIDSFLEWFEEFEEIGLIGHPVDWSDEQ